MKHDLETLDKLYKSEVNICIISDWDGGYFVGIGCENGNPDTCVFKTTKKTLQESVDWLVEKALSEYPSSIFSYNYNRVEE